MYQERICRNLRSISDYKEESTMKGTIKELLTSTLISIGTAMAIFCIIGIVFDISYGGNFSLDHYRFTKMVIGCLFVGLGFGVPSIVYKKESLPMPLRVLIHLGIGFAVYTIVAYAVGWIGDSATIGQGLLIACIQIAVVLVVWFIFFRHYKNEAKRINERLSELNK